MRNTGIHTRLALEESREHQRGRERNEREHVPKKNKRAMSKDGKKENHNGEKGKK